MDFYDELGDEKKELYLMDCMKITGLRGNEVVGWIFRMTQSMWMASSLYNYSK